MVEAQNQDPDQGPLARVAAGDVESFGILVERHQDRLVRLCERLLGDPEAARDASQEVFLKAFRKASSYKPRGKVYTWLYRIAVNHCLNQIRRRKVVQFLSFGELGQRPAADEDESADFDPKDPAPSPGQVLLARRRWHELRRQIDALPAGQQAVLVLIRLEGFSYRQTAQILGISEGAVESRLFRAMQKLSRAQENELPGVAHSDSRVGGP